MQVKLVISYLPFLVSERQNFMEKSLKSDTKLSAEDGVNTHVKDIWWVWDFSQLSSEIRLNDFIMLSLSYFPDLVPVGRLE